MQLRHLTSLLQATEGINKVTAIAWSPNNKRLAVVTVDRVVHLFDAQSGERKDKFSTKPSEKGDKSYVVRALEFSPDSTKLAVAQSDNIVFVYKIGLEWGDKKSICNKFPQQSSITSLTWPSSHPNELVFGIADGKVKIGQLRNNKPATLYSTGSYVSTVCSNIDGTAILSAHYDGAIYRFIFDDVNGGHSHAKIAVHSCIPYALSWGESVVAAGNDRKVVFYDQDGGVQRTFDYSGDEDCGEFTCSVTNPTGDSVVVGNFDSFYIYSLQAKTNVWEALPPKRIANLYSVTALAWKHDGSRLALGSVCGALDLFDACVRRYRYRGKFEFTYVSLSQVIVKQLSNGARVVVRSTFGCEITKINIFQDRFIICNTSNTLLVGDLEFGKLSEVPWQSTGNEKYMFDNENVCVVFQAGELTLIEYGQNEILGSVRTEHFTTHLLSVRVNEKPTINIAGLQQASINPENEENHKKVAFLLDLQTISIKDLHMHSTSVINHDVRIDWMELNMRGNLLLFRDKRRQLHLFDMATQQRMTLLNFCNYVQWVPESDVVVAQNRSNLSVWYNIRSPDRATMYQVKGEVERIERANGRTEVIVDEGMNTASYQLDEALIAFGTAVDYKQLPQAMAILEPLPLAPEALAMWKQLSEEALASNDHRIAERCAAALGDVARTRFLRRMNKIDWMESGKLGEGMTHWRVRTQLCLLKNDYRAAEHVLLSQGQLDAAIEMYQHLHKWEDAIRVAESKSHPNTDGMKRNYYEYLVESRQEDKAAELKVKENDYAAAVGLYLKGGLPAKAAHLLNQRNVGRDHKHLVETVAEALYNAGLFDKAGEQYEKLEQESRALAAYIKANAFRQAVELARRHFPDKVLRLEEAWGDCLVSQKQMDMAISHYIEGNVPTKAVEAALNSRQWAKAGQLVENLDEETAMPFYRRLARHYQDAQNYVEAERCFIKADAARDAVEMYTRVNKWDLAYQVAMNHLDKYETERLYVDQAHRMERQGKFKEAEKLFLTVNEPDLAINMYKNQQNYEQMIRLVTKYRKDLLKDTHLFLAQQLEHEGNYKQAEHHFSEAGEWQTAVNMYRTNDMWDEAIRVAKFHGGINASKRVAYAWAMELGGDQGAKLLTRLGLIEPAIDYAVESGAFDHAFELANNCAPKKLPEVHLKHALYLEDEERFKEAEEEFIKASKPREALDMYIHQQDWQNAMRVAETNDPAAVSDVYVAQAQLWVERKEFQRAEGFFVSGGKPDLALSAYVENGLWQDALRLAKRYLPHKLGEVNMAHQRAVFSGGPKSKEELIEACEMWVYSQQYVQAIDAYLTISLDHVSNDPEALEEFWAKAVDLAGKYDRGRYKSVVEEVASRLLGMSRFEAAADYFKLIDKMNEALDCYLRVNNWEGAQRLCEQHAPELLPRLERAQQASAFGSGAAEAKTTDAYMPSSNDAKGIRAMGAKETKMPHSSNADGDIGNQAEGNVLDAWMMKGEWDKVLSSAAKQSPAMLSRYLVLRCSRLCEHNDVDTAVKTIAQYGVPLELEALEIVETIVKKSLQVPQEIETGETHQSAVKKLAQCLRQLIKQLRNGHSAATPEDIANFDRLLLITHYVSISHQATRANLDEIAARVSMSLLRFVGEVLPRDKMFFLAGSTSKKAKKLSAAFVFYNHYLDLSEALEDGDASNLDDTDFVDTDIPPPTDTPLPESQFVADESVREEVRDWVLTISMDQQVQEKLPERNCNQCQAAIYEAALICPHCHHADEACIITGFPVLAKATAHCATCKVIADREVWNKWVGHFGTCPWCVAPQKINY